MQAGAAENGDPAAGETVKRGADPGGQMGEFPWLSAVNPASGTRPVRLRAVSACFGGQGGLQQALQTPECGLFPKVGETALRQILPAVPLIEPLQQSTGLRQGHCDSDLLHIASCRWGEAAGISIYQEYQMKGSAYAGPLAVLGGLWAGPFLSVRMGENFRMNSASR